MVVTMRGSAGSRPLVPIGVAPPFAFAPALDPERRRSAPPFLARVHFRGPTGGATKWATCVRHLVSPSCDPRK